MNESLLRSLLKLFLVIVEPERKGLSKKAIGVIATFLEKDLSKEEVNGYLIEIEAGIKSRIRSADTDTFSEDSIHSSIERICAQINAEFEQHQKIWITLQLIEFVGDSGYITDGTLELIQLVASKFNVSLEEFDAGKDFVLSQTPEGMPQTPNLLAVSDQTPLPGGTVKHQYHRTRGALFFILRIASTNTLLVKYFGEEEFFLNSRLMRPGRAYLFSSGSVVRGHNTEPLYYSSVLSVFFFATKRSIVRFSALNISYKHKGSSEGVRPFSFEAESGQFIGIIGGSGVGKSTLINLFNGNLKPATGRVLVNGYDFATDKKKLKGVIGYIPQDDLLIEDLTVYQNLYYSAKFCFGNHDSSSIEKVVNETIADFDLNEARNLKVGNPLKKFISGGQRKRLNIAIELMREPAVLFADEPSSGLSSFDSERILLLLKRQTLKGKLVIANIHQPSSATLRLFDRILVMDQGGRVIYQGNPMDAMGYFRHEGNYLKPNESECQCCGNVDAEQILRVVEARVVNEYGKLTRKRKRPSKEWYEMYKTKIESKLHFTQRPSPTPLPSNHFRVPNRWKQTWLFFFRNLYSKLANSQFNTISLLEAPILALILGFFSKYAVGTLNNANAYIFSENDNLPSYFFMSVVALLFLGLTMSAEEIIRDRKIRKREKFLSLSHFSYINSKVILLLIYSAIQSLQFVLVGNYVLEIHDSLFTSWLILFSVSVCANFISLNISAALNSVVAIYVTIPLIMIPMLLLSGVVVGYDKLHRYIRNPEYVPLMADIMPTRWSYEALCVEHFKKNRFNKEFFAYDQALSNNSYVVSFLLPRLDIELSEVSKNIAIGKTTSVTQSNLKLIQSELGLLQRDYPVAGAPILDTALINPATVTIAEIDSLQQLIAQARKAYLNLNNSISRAKDRHIDSLILASGNKEHIFNLKRKYHNRAIEDLVLNRMEMVKITREDNRLIRKYNTGYAIPTSTIGRAPLYAPVKRIGNISIDTLWFNLGVLWFMSLLLYCALLTSFFIIVHSYVERFRFRRLTKRIARYLPK